MNPFPLNRLFRLLLVAACGLAWCTELKAQQRRSGTGSAAQAAGAGMQRRQYRSHTLLGDALIEVDSETRSLVVVTDEQTNEQIRKVIESLDQPKPQVLIKVLFLEVTHSDGLDMGLEGRYAYRDKEINQGSVETILGLAQQIDGGFWSVLANDWQFTLRAIAQKGKLEVLSRPSILARNNQEAVIVVGEEVPFVTNSRITDNGQTINTIQYAEVGIILRVTPFITSEGLVEMIVAPEISTLTEETVAISETVSSPVIAKRSAETVVVTPDGSTVVIGGLMETKKTEAVRKIPVLGDIPLLGMAFRRKITERVKKELLVFLTPHIVGTPAALAGVSKREVNETRMAPSVFPQEDLETYLEGQSLRETEEAGARRR
ncbi:MAG: hypothetical protein JXR37_33690 [Kiritimatiellae bacterium]|nr:hypothetical protein [Kiritimatiellia bacterium]